jgi:AmmeMemoRadiSam system protein A
VPEAVPQAPLSDQDRRFLLELARSSIAARLDGRPRPEPSLVPGPLTENRGAFVTLTIDDRLRGCIGHVVGVEPLWSSVRSNAVAAAFRDPRFEPLGPEELDRVVIEVSALSPVVEIDDPEEVEVGLHGLMIERGASRGLLLPQVATKNGWDRLAFLDHTCRKAGLAAGCWRDPESRISVFTVEHFAETEEL